VDGIAPTDDDTAHRGHDAEATGLDTVSAAMERRSAKALAHDADPSAERVRSDFGGWNLGQLRRERDRLEAILGDAPLDVSAALVAAGRRHDALAAKRRSWTDRIATAQRDARSWSPHNRRAASPVVDKAQRELASIDASLAGLEVRIGALRSQWQRRHAYFESHAEDVDRFNLVRRAEQARELQVRMDAHVRPPEVIVAMLGAEPKIPAARQAWLRAAETHAVHDERFGADFNDGSEGRWSQRLAEDANDRARAELGGEAFVEAELSLP
jgi:hypothetical protein